jgi:hypothetical protein
MPTFWIAAVVDRLPENFTDGIILAEGLDQDTEPDPSQLQFAILARVAASAEDEASQQIAQALSGWGLSHSTKLADEDSDIPRAERRIAAQLKSGDVSLRSSFVGFKRNNTGARKQAISVLGEAISKRWWQFWR